MEYRSSEKILEKKTVQKIFSAAENNPLDEKMDVESNEVSCVK